jgi:nucleotide-binding universal stress UspA family protein/GNAT superfamily N-acetyltransferase
MFRRVLIATDFSRHADRVLECIGDIPGMEEILLLHVISGGSETQEAAARLLETKKRILAPFDIPLRTLVVQSEYGDIVRSITLTATHERASLIVMGARGRNLLRTLVLGTVSRGVIESGTTDVLILHFRGEDAPDPVNLEKYCQNIFYRILCPVDFSKPTADVLAFLSHLPLVREVILLHVLPAPAPGERIANREAQAAAHLEKAKTALNLPEGRVRAMIRSGDPAAEIAACAEKEDVSLVLIPRFGSGDYATSIPIGRTAAAVARRVQRPLLVRYPLLHLDVEAHELPTSEFGRAEEIWQAYRRQKADRNTDRIFGVFVEGELAAVARCRRHPDGLEVDGVFTGERFRNRGYAHKAVQALISACGGTTLYMHSTMPLVTFYSSFGFTPISERELPESIRARFDFAGGNLEGANAVPMRRLSPA